MRQRKLFQILMLFSREDLQGFRAFLTNPFFNNRKILLTFFELCRKRVLDLPPDQDCTVEEFLRGTRINPGRIDKLCSALYRMACNYLVVTTLQEDEYARQGLLLQALEKRDLGGKELERMYKRSRSRVERQKESPQKILRSLNLRWKTAESAIRSRDTSALWQEDFQDLHTLLDHYYHLQKLRLLSASANAENIYNRPEEAREPIPDDFPERIGKMAFDPLSHAYVLTIRMFRSEDGAACFRELLQLLSRDAHRFAPSEGMELYGYALNFCIWNSNQGRLEYLQHASALYAQLLENGLILEGNELLPQQFKNIVSLHCRLGMLDWVRGFIDRYARYLPPDSRGFALLYNEAVLSFHQGEYPAAIRGFKEVIASLTDDIFYGLDARVYLWKAYFEHFARLSMEEVDEMFRLYDAFRLFIERNEKISAVHKQHYRNFIRAFKRFMEILRSRPVRRKELVELREMVSDLGSVANKGWFLAKIDDSLVGLEGD